MSYKVNEIFYSIQGEGYYAGKPAVFIRFSGCNLKCPWCDTKHESGTIYTKEQLEGEVERLTQGNESILIVFTGGEPTLQLSEDEELLPKYYRAIETNGTNKVPDWIDWITISPKTDIKFKDFRNFPDEIKVVYESKRKIYLEYLKHLGGRLYLQPLEQNGKMNIAETLEYIKQNPEYTLSVQLHKLIGAR